MPESRPNICVDCGNSCTRRAQRCARCKMLKLNKDQPDLVHKMNRARMRPGWKENLKDKLRIFFSDPDKKTKWLETLQKRPRRFGDKAPAWKGGLSSKNEIMRSSQEYKDWRNSVFGRDNYTCQVCGYSGKNLHAHHIVEWSKDENKRFDISNGKTLCRTCHSKIHKKNIRNKPNHI